MLKGFHYPLTPKGKSTLNPAPPWYYSSDFLSVEFWADASAVAAILPPGLEADRSANGHGAAFFYDWQFSGNNEEYLDPERYQYREFFILLDALYDGKPVSYCLIFLSTMMQHWRAAGRRDIQSALARYFRPGTTRLPEKPARLLRRDRNLQAPSPPAVAVLPRQS